MSTAQWITKKQADGVFPKDLKKKTEQLVSKSGCSKKNGWVDWYDRTLDVERDGWSGTPPSPIFSPHVFLLVNFLTHWAFMSTLFPMQQHGDSLSGRSTQIVHGLHLSLTNSWMEENHASALEKLLKLNFEVWRVVLIDNNQYNLLSSELQS